MSGDAPAPKRRATARPKRQAGAFSQPPWRRLENPFPPIALLTDDQIEAIHQASLTILSEMGIEFMSAEARRILSTTG